MSLMLKTARANIAGQGMPGVGDPGLFGTIGGVFNKVAGVAKNIPGPIGWAGSAVQRLTNRTPANAVSPNFMNVGGTRVPVLTGPRLSLPVQRTPGITGFAQRVVPGGQTGYQVDAPPIGAPTGYHVNATDYFLKDGTFIPKGSRWVKNRRRNPLNPRAASKAISRIEQLKRATKRFGRITIRKKCSS